MNDLKSKFLVFCSMLFAVLCFMAPIQNVMSCYIQKLGACGLENDDGCSEFCSKNEYSGCRNAVITEKLQMCEGSATGLCDCVKIGTGPALCFRVIECYSEDDVCVQPQFGYSCITGFTLTSHNIYPTGPAGNPCQI